MGYALLLNLILIGFFGLIGISMIRQIKWLHTDFQRWNEEPIQSLMLLVITQVTHLSDIEKQVADELDHHGNGENDQVSGHDVFDVHAVTAL